MKILLNPFIQLWIAMTLLSFAFIALIVYWAIKNKQFSDQERANSIPLDDLKANNNTKEQE